MYALQLKDLAESGPPPAQPPRRESTTSHSNSAYGARLDIDPLQPSRSYDKKYSLLDPRSLQKLFKAKQSQSHDEDVEEEENEAPPADDGVEYTRVQAPASKRIAIPVRIEPKVIFANERTFLKVS